MPETKTWPFGTDADRDDPLTAHRIAVTSSHPGWAYLVAFDSASEARPDERETAMLASCLEEYKERWYGHKGFRAQMEERALDVDGGANGLVFHKYGDGDWGYRRRSWRSGPMFIPQHPNCRDADSPGPLTLAEVLDRVHTHGTNKVSPDWAAWKAAHPEVFGS